MTLVVILNIIGCAFVLIGICTLLGWAIQSSCAARPSEVVLRGERRRPAPARSRPAAQRSGRLRPFPS